MKLPIKFSVSADGLWCIWIVGMELPIAIKHLSLLRWLWCHIWHRSMWIPTIDSHRKCVETYYYCDTCERKRVYTLWERVTW